jgi:hypothetical protein
MTLEERQAITRKLIADEEHQLQVLGYNPITKTFMAPAASVRPSIDQNLPFPPQTITSPLLVRAAM